MMICDECEKKWECTTPCKKAVAWEPLDKKYYNYDYKPIGIAWYNPWSEESEKKRRRLNFK